MFAYLFSSYKEPQHTESSFNGNPKRYSCPECTTSYTIYEVLNNNYRCPECGALIEIEEEERPTVFS